MKVSIVGAGHVGLVTGACLAELGHNVLCVDIDRQKIEGLDKGELPFYEPGLDQLIERNQRARRLHFGTTVREALDWSSMVFICVNTPPGDDGSADLSYVEGVAREIAGLARGYCLVVEKSTVPVQTGERLRQTFERYGNKECEIDIACVPEFLREGSAVQDTLHPDRVVIGCSTERAAKALQELLGPIAAPTIVTDINTAELIKHASNSFLALKISYINAVAAVCEQTGADVTIVARAMGLDHRIGKEFLAAGVGYGGSCFPKDISAFAKMAEAVGYRFGLLHETQEINSQARQRVFDKIRQALWVLRGKRIAILGLAFKPNTDDIREAPSIDIIERLLASGASVRAYDPKAMPNMRSIFGERIAYGSNPYDAAEEADALVLLTEWKEFSDLDWPRMRNTLRVPIVVDGRNLWDPGVVRAEGLTYIGVGR